MNIQKFKSYKVSGNTFAVKEELKKIGATWDKPSESWIIRTGGMKEIGQQKFVLGNCEKRGCQIEEI